MTIKIYTSPKRFIEISRGEIARKLGVSQQAVSKWFLGKAMPRMSHVVKLSELLDVTVDKVVEILEKNR